VTVEKCRVCGNPDLKEFINLGNLAFTGIFPKSLNEKVPTGFLRLARCSGDKNKVCGAVQLLDSFPSHILYGDSYGYRSALNISMVNHLKDIAEEALKTARPKKGDIIIDIGSNDGTLLSFFPEDYYILIGVDPTIKKFGKYYRKDILQVDNFFDKKHIDSLLCGKKAKIITSIAMFYDLEDPIAFAIDINHMLDKKGIWIFEQSYTPNIFKKCGYDTICHEHLLYYSLRDINWILDKAELKIVNIGLNNVNGASIRITASKKSSDYPEALKKIRGIMEYERKIGYEDEDFFRFFVNQVFNHKTELNKVLDRLCAENKKIFGYGASTKGNVILQFCQLNSEKIPYVAEVNENKFGCFTPGTKIPIISEEEAKKIKPDYFLVLPWHFKKGIIKKEQAFLKNGGGLIFPLPKVEIIYG